MAVIKYKYKDEKGEEKWGTLPALVGKDGKSAYEVAVDNGFEGSEEEWLESLKGEKGDVSKTVYIGLDGYCYTEEGFPYPITNLDLSEGVEQRYNFMLVDDDSKTKMFTPLTVANDGLGYLYFSAIWSEFYGTLYRIAGVYDLTSGEDAVTFDTVQKVAGEFLKDTHGVLSVDKDALLGDVETALDNIIAMQNSLIGGES